MRLEVRRYIQYSEFDSSVEDYLFPGCAKLFFFTEAANDDTRNFLCSCVIPPNNFSTIPEFVRNVHHLYQLQDCLVSVALVILLVASRLPLVMVSRR